MDSLGNWRGACACEWCSRRALFTTIFVATSRREIFHPSSTDTVGNATEQSNVQSVTKICRLLPDCNESAVGRIIQLLFWVECRPVERDSTTRGDGGGELPHRN